MLTARGEEVDKIVGPRVGSRRLRREAVQRRRARRPHARDHAARPRHRAQGPRHRRSITLDPAARTVTKRDEPVELAAKEFDLLHLLMTNAGQVCTREQIMDEVWDPHWFGPTKTLDVHVSWLRKKIEDDPSNPRFITTVRGVGFRFASPDEAARSAVKVRTRLVLAFAYVLITVIVALTIPLAVTLRSRATTENLSQALSNAQTLAASIGKAGLGDAARPELVTEVDRAAANIPGGHVVVVDGDGNVLADSDGAHLPGENLKNGLRLEFERALACPDRRPTAASVRATHSAQTSSSPPHRSSTVRASAPPSAPSGSRRTSGRSSRT